MAQLIVLKESVKHPLVKKWQLFLHGQGFTFETPRDGVFGPETKRHTIEFQTKYKLTADGIVGNETLGKAMTLGFEAVDFTADKASGYPAKPAFPPLVGTAARQAKFGPLKYKYIGVGENGKETIKITNDFESTKIVNVEIPQLKGIPGAPKNGVVEFHRDAARQLQDLWAAWEKASLLDRVLRWDGGFVPRMIRCSTKSLSNHAFGTAFDINAAQNPLGSEPAWPGEKGCVFELVPIAHKFGFYWGGHFSDRRDGMHFEIARIL